MDNDVSFVIDKDNQLSIYCKKGNRWMRTKTTFGCDAERLP